MLIGFIVIATAFLIRSSRRRRSIRAAHLRLDAAIETVDFLLAMLRAGYSLPQSLMKLGDVTSRIVRADFVHLRDAIAAGRSLHEALTDVRTRLGPEFSSLIDLLASAVRLGIPTESLVVHIHHEARFARRRQGEILARQLSVRLTLPLVLCTLPSFVFLIIVPIVMGTIAQLRLNGTTP
ncbi:MAG: type II secretion system F family protein [Actinomycetota bacterium]